jgi:hypothetical protein
MHTQADACCSVKWILSFGIAVRVNRNGMTSLVYPQDICQLSINSCASVRIWKTVVPELIKAEAFGLEVCPGAPGWDVA